MLVLQSEVVAAVGDEHVELLEAALVEDHLDSFPGRVFPLLVLVLDALLTATQPGFFAQLDELTHPLVIPHCL